LLILGCFAAVALVLAAVGVYGVVSSSVSRRTREIGVRMALGARPADVLRAVLREGAFVIGLGTGGGALAALGLTRFARSLLFGVSPVDPLTFGATTAVLAATALAACALPARRAARLDPVRALRTE
jgi:ABC-type antimicrobial peptide transport system permease subunit